MQIQSEIIYPESIMAHSYFVFEYTYIMERQLWKFTTANHRWRFSVCESRSTFLFRRTYVHVRAKMKCGTFFFFFFFLLKKVNTPTFVQTSTGMCAGLLSEYTGSVAQLLFFFTPVCRFLKLHLRLFWNTLLTQTETSLWQVGLKIIIFFSQFVRIKLIISKILSELITRRHNNTLANSSIKNWLTACCLQWTSFSGILPAATWNLFIT